MSPQFFNNLVDLPELMGNADALWTMGLTLSALDTVVGLTIARYHTIQGDQVLTTMFAILRIAHTHWQ